jgi:hypothetical protein
VFVRGLKFFFKESALRGRIGARCKTVRIKRQEKRGKKQRGMVGLGQDVPATEEVGKMPTLLEDGGGTPAVPWKRRLLSIFR